MVKIILPRQYGVGRISALARLRARSHTQVTNFSTSAARHGYEATINNLKIGKHTRVLYQGFTGKQATSNAKESIEFGTNVVGGVKPGVEGEHLGLPVVPSVRAAVEKLKPDASAIYVPGNGTVTAMEEAIENEIPLIVAVAEHIPIHDILRIQQMLRTQSKTRLVGANCPGIISVHGRCRIGFQPLPFYKEGNVGIVAKSGTLSYEAVASTTRAGLGQTYGISMGGDVLAGTNFVESFQVLTEDPNTEGIIFIGEVGGVAELDAVEWIQDYRRRTADPKPFLALLGGVRAPPSRIMGHAGAWAGPGEPSAAEKIKRIEKAGIETVDHPEKLGGVMKRLLEEKAKSKSSGGKAASGPGAMQQKRGYHSMRRRPQAQSQRTVPHQQTRSLYLKQNDAFDMLKEKRIRVTDSPSGSQEKLLAVAIDRSSRQPCITVSEDPESLAQAQKFPFAYGSDEATSSTMTDRVSNALGLSAATKEKLPAVIKGLVEIFMQKEAFSLETKIVADDDGEIIVQAAKFGFDDAAFRSSGRQKDVHALRDIESEVDQDVAAEEYGMIYVKMEGDGTIGTLVNGAGLAMNTVDALIARGGSPANFLDTGGKATSETVKAGFKIITSDPRVKVIFVNIFGGLTLGDMIANGVLMAFKDLNLKVPVVVRIRGTREKEGQKVISDSGLKMDAYDSFEEAAARAIAIANGTAKME